MSATVEDQLQRAGLTLLGPCEGLSGRGPELLRHAALLEDFGPAELDALGAAMLRVRARPGQVLIAEGEIGEWMLLVLSGTVDVTKRTSPGAAEPESSRLGVIKAGTSLGEMSMLDGGLRYASCTALDEVEAAVLSRPAMGRLIREHPAVGAKLLVKITQQLAQRLRNVSNQLVRMLQKE